MEIGKLYKEIKTDYIVECHYIQNDNRFDGVIIDKGNSTFWKKGDIGVGFDTNLFIDLKAIPLNMPIGGEHYSKNKIQPIDYILANDMDFVSGNIIKYVTRYKHKNGLEDLKKAKHYLEILINNYEVSKGVE